MLPGMTIHRTHMATGGTLAALGVLAAVALGTGGAPASNEATAAAPPQVRNEVVRRTVRVRAKGSGSGARASSGSGAAAPAAAPAPAAPAASAPAPVASAGDDNPHAEDYGDDRGHGRGHGRGRGRGGDDGGDDD